MMDATAFVTALAALFISAAALWQFMRQRKNEIRPVLVLIERPIRGGDEALGLYLVNMGNAAAMDVAVDWHGTPDDLRPAGSMQTAVAAGRRIALVAGYHQGRLHRVAISARYRDLDGDEHRMTYTPPATAGGRGTHRFEPRMWLPGSVGHG